MWFLFFIGNHYEGLMASLMSARTGWILWVVFRMQSLRMLSSKKKPWGQPVFRRLMANYFPLSVPNISFKKLINIVPW